MSEVFLWSHVGTHIEAPFHYFKDGTDVAGLALERVVGECVLVDFTDKGVGEEIGLAEMEERAAGVRPGDIVFVRTDSGNYRTAQSHTGHISPRMRSGGWSSARSAVSGSTAPGSSVAASRGSRTTSGCSATGSL